MNELRVVSETTEAQHLVGLVVNERWLPETLLCWIYGEDCEYGIVRRQYPNGYKVVDVECSDASKLRFGLHGPEVLYVHEMCN